MKLIPLNKEKFAIVDDEDFERLNQLKWIAWKRAGQELWYALRTTKRTKFETSTDRKMDRHIIQIPDGFLADHKNGDGLDYRKENLRLATPLQNSWNRKKGKRASSRFKGVSKAKNKWQARVGKACIGRFPCQTCAALAYDIAALKKYGEFARPNILTVFNQRISS